LALVSNPKAI